MFRLNGLASATRGIIGGSGPSGGGGNVYDGTYLHYIADPNISGTYNADYFGGQAYSVGQINYKSIAVTDNYIIASAAYEDTPSTDAGTVYVFDINDYSTVYTINGLTVGSAASDYLGKAVGAYGDRLYISAPGEDAVGSLSGTMWVIDLTTGSTVTQINDPNGYGSTSSDQFATAIACGSTYTVASAVYEDGASGVSEGMVYVFDTATGAYQYNIPNINQPGNTGVVDQFGSALAVEGDIAVIGCQNEEVGGASNAGAVYVYNLATQTVVWNIPSPTGVASTFFGASVAISGDLIVIGAPNEVSSEGRVYVYSLFTGQLLYTLHDNDYGEYTLNQFGNSVSVDNGYIGVGAFYERYNFNYIGTYYLYDSSGNKITSIQWPNTNGMNNFGVQFGAYSAMGGGKIVVSAPKEYDPATGYQNMGAIYVFD